MTTPVYNSLKYFPSIARYIELAQRVGWIASVAERSKQWKAARMLLMSRDIDRALITACPWLSVSAHVYAEQDHREFVWAYQRSVEAYARALSDFVRALNVDMEHSDDAEKIGG